MSADGPKLRSLQGREVTGQLLRAARVLLGVSAEDLASQAMLSVATVKRAEARRGPIGLTTSNSERLIEVFQRANIRLVAHDELGLGVFKADLAATASEQGEAA